MKFDDTLEAFEAMLVVVYAFEMQPTFCLILQYFATTNLLSSRFCVALPKSRSAASSFCL